MMFFRFRFKKTSNAILAFAITSGFGMNLNPAVRRPSMVTCLRPAEGVLTVAVAHQFPLIAVRQLEVAHNIARIR
jgi:hypothetical protein